MEKKLLILIIIFSTISCGHLKDRSAISSGKIDYQITYLNTDLDKKTRNILPSRMKLAFNEKQAANNIEGFMGMYKLNAFTNFNTRRCSTVLKVLDKHYIFKGSKDEQMCCFDMMEDMQINETDETKMIAGFLCKKAIVYIPSRDYTFNIYYTEQIRLKNANTTNPYKQVKGVLMEFELNLLYLKMRFVAEKYQPLNGYEFKPNLKENTRMVSRSQMTQILNKLMQ